LGGEPFESIWERGGREFRDWERQAVAEASRAPVATVIACGGGAVLDASNRRVLRAHGTVVWLDADADVLAARTAGDDGRPLLATGDRRATLARLARLRAGAYEAAAHVRVDTGALDEDA